MLILEEGGDFEVHKPPAHMTYAINTNAETHSAISSHGVSRLRWKHDGRFFTGVSHQGEPLQAGSDGSVLKAICRMWRDTPAPMVVQGGPSATAQGPLRVKMQHTLHESRIGFGEDLLEASLVIQNVSKDLAEVEVIFSTPIRLSPDVQQERAYLPLNVAGIFRDVRFNDLGGEQLLGDCDQPVGRGVFQAHYLEPMASYPGERTTRALLLAPVVDLSHPATPLRLTLFTSSLEARRFSNRSAGSEKDEWQASRCVTISPGATITERCWLLLHEGDAAKAWDVFHCFGHEEEHTPLEWPQKVRVHYYDFLSSSVGEAGRRGDGYYADLAHFREFRVGMATQHGYYPATGDYIHPDRKTWRAMQGDKAGSAEMSLDLMRRRIAATRATGATAAIYIHSVLLDEAASCFPEMKESVQINASGAPMDFIWSGPDTVGKAWRASLNSPQWQKHLLQQVQWIMELLDPDAIVVDETFSGLGYDHNPAHPGPISYSAISFYRKLRSLVRSFGADKAVFTSDCSMSEFVMWADGECDDRILTVNSQGHPLWQTDLPNKDWVVGGSTFATDGNMLYFIAGTPVAYSRPYNLLWNPLTLIEPNLCRVAMTPGSKAEVIVARDKFSWDPIWIRPEISLTSSPSGDKVYLGYSTSSTGPGKFAIYEVGAPEQKELLFETGLKGGRVSMDENGHFYVASGRSVQKLDLAGKPVAGFEPQPLLELRALPTKYEGSVILTKDYIWDAGHYGFIGRFTRDFAPSPGLVSQWEHALSRVSQIVDGPAETYYIKSTDALYHAKPEGDKLQLLSRFGALPEIAALAVTSNGYVGAGTASLEGMLWFDFDAADAAAPVRAEYPGPVSQGYTQGESAFAYGFRPGYTPAQYPPRPAEVTLFHFAPEPFNASRNHSSGVGEGTFPGEVGAVAPVGGFNYFIDAKAHRLMRVLPEKPLEFIPVEDLALPEGAKLMSVSALSRDHLPSNRRQHPGRRQRQSRRSVRCWQSTRGEAARAVGRRA